MYPAIIENYEAPRSVNEALEALTKNGKDSYFIAGGQSLMQAIKARVLSPKSLIDLQHVNELKGTEYNQGAVRIGAMTRYRDIAADERLDGAYQALRDAATHVGDRQVRNRGTIGGSLCWNYIAACMPPTCIGIGASLDLVSRAGRRSLLAEEFLHGPLETARHDDEIVVAVTLPRPPEMSGSAYKKWGLVTDALPVVGVCASVELGDDRRCRKARLAIGGLATGPRRAKAGEKALIGVAAADAAAISKAAETAAASTETQSDMWADAEYRKKLIETLAREVITTAFARAEQGNRS
jgi:aerobic carbon-monoxide dehydrogenase medium subunit